MAYDHELAHRIRALLGDTPFDERAMFGGLAFLVGGKMAVAANRAGTLMVRVDSAESEELVSADGVRRMVMGGREMSGWVQVEQQVIEEDAVLAEWIERGIAQARAAR